MVTEKQIEAAQRAYTAHVAEHGVEGATEAMRTAIEAADAAAWEPIDTAPKGHPAPYKNGPAVLGVARGDGWCAYNIVSWRWHKNSKTGSWVARHGGTWDPAHWRPLPTPPEDSE